MQPMDKTSKLFLREQIRRINNLNSRIESQYFILENVTPELQKSLDDLQELLVQKIVTHTSQDVDKVKPFINDILLNDVLKSRTYCGGEGKIDCLPIAKYYNKYFKEIDIKSFGDVTDVHDYILKRLLQLPQEKLAEKLTKELGEKVTLPPTILNDSKIAAFLSLYIPLKNDLLKYKLVDNFENFMKEMKELLKKGEFCKKFKFKGACTEGAMIRLRNENIQSYKNSIDEYDHLDGLIESFIIRVKKSKDEIKQTQLLNDSDFDSLVSNLEEDLQNGTFFREKYPNVDLKDVNEVKKTFLLYLQKLKQESLRPVDIVNLMKRWDADIQPGLVKNLGGDDVAKRNANITRSEFKEALDDGTFCEDCKTRGEKIKKAEESMDLILKYSGTKIPEGMGRFEFLQSKIDELLVLNQSTDSTKEEKDKVISIDQLKEFAAAGKARQFMMVIESPELKSAITAFMEKNPKIDGNFQDWNDSRKYITFQAFGKDQSGNYQFVIDGLDEGLIYPKIYKVYLKKEEPLKSGKYVKAAPAPFKVKIKSVNKK